MTNETMDDMMEYEEEHDMGLFGDGGENDILYLSLIGVGCFLVGVGVGFGIYYAVDWD